MLPSIRSNLGRAALAAVAVIALGGQTVTRDGPVWVETESGYLTGSGITRLRVDAGGPVTVRGGGGTSLAWRTRRTIRARGEDRSAFPGRPARVRRAGDIAVIETLVALPGVTTEVEILIPAGLRRAAVYTASGDVTLRELGADIEAGTGGGRIDADGVAGSLEARTSGGEIRVGQVSGELRAISGGGPIQIRQAGAALVAETGGGEIFIDRAGGDVRAATAAGNIHVVHAAGNVDARTAGGLIRVSEAGGVVRADSGGGVIQVTAAGGVRCESMGGPIRLLGVAGQLFAVTTRGSIFADLLPGRVLSNSILSAESGDITVIIPSNLAVTVEAVSDSGRPGPIHTDFPEIRVGPLEPGGRTVANGKLNGGGPLLKVAAARGAVFLKRK